MAQPKILVLRAPGTNCDEETAYAFQLAGGFPQSVHINRLLDEPAIADEFQILCIPGGFSYGDDIAAGRILASQMDHRLSEALSRFRDANKLILGICNGFQVLLRAGLLIDTAGGSAATTLTWNDNGRFEDRWVYLKPSGDRCVFLRGVQQMELPIAHAEGRFVCTDDQLCQVLEQQGHLALKYVRPDGSNGDVPFPYNPNGSARNVAGICDRSGRIFGLMPHPERHVEGTHHPQWTRRGLQNYPDGLKIFQNAVQYFA